MIFTGKAKEQFENWYNGQTWNDDDLDNDVHCFYLLHESMQWGVIQDFADVLEDEQEIVIMPRVSKGWDCYFITIMGNMRKFDTREEARNEAIKQLNEYLNK